jgi:N-acetylglucosamine malate deacetylase 1
MLSGIARALVLAPHTDDGELGAGGTIVKLLESGTQVFYVAFSTAEESLVQLGLPIDQTRQEVKNATQLLGIPPENLIIYNFPVRKLNYHRQEILEIMVELKQRINPNLVLMPCLHDIHQDHTTVATEGHRAFKHTTMLGYELVWNNFTFNSQCFIRLTEAQLQKKVDACHEYISQEGRPYMSKEFLFSLARTRGVQIAVDYAESFELIRLVY